MPRRVRARNLLVGFIAPWVLYPSSCCLLIVFVAELMPRTLDMAGEHLWIWRGLREEQRRYEAERWLGFHREWWCWSPLWRCGSRALWDLVKQCAAHFLCHRMEVIIQTDVRGPCIPTEGLHRITVKIKLPRCARRGGHSAATGIQFEADACRRR